MANFEMPRQDNKFLSNNLASQFAKSNTEDMGKMFGGALDLTNKLISKQNVVSLADANHSKKNLDVNTDTNKEILKQTKILEDNQKMFEEFSKVMSSTKDLLKSSAGEKKKEKWWFW